MNAYNSERPKAWNIFTSSYPTPSPLGGERHAQWKNDYASSMNAISFGFVATAVLIAMFIILAIFEHLFKPTSDQQGTHRLSMDMDKFQPLETVSSSYSMDFSVVMPGQKNPSYIAHHAPLPPCSREERPKAWNIFTSSYPTPSPLGGERHAQWKNDYASSMNAISFGFVATAVLIAMFIILAIFEHLFKPTSDQQGTHRLSMDMDKFQPLETVSSSYSMDFSVVMPGQKNPSYIAHHAPLPPCSREGVLWPSHHQHNISLPKPANPNTC